MSASRSEQPAVALVTGAPVSDLCGHPRGLMVCFFTEMWERFSFYGMKALLLLFLLKHHLFADQEGYLLLGAYAGLVYAVPLLGGYVADRLLGMRKAVVLGALLLCAGHLGMAVEGSAATRNALGTVQRDAAGMLALYLSLAAIIIGVGFLKPNIASMVGRLYAPGDPRRDAGFTLYYAGIHLGALFSSLICGYLGEVYGWRYGFGAAGIGMLAGLLVFLSGQRHLLGIAEPPDTAALRRRTVLGLTVETLIYAAAVVAVPLVAALLHWPAAVAGLQGLALAVWGVWFAWYLAARCSPAQRRRMASILFYIGFVLLFFSLYEQTYGAWITFTDRMLDKDLFPALVIRSGNPLPWSVLPLVLSAPIVAWALAAREARQALLALALLAALSAVLIVRDSVVLPQTAGSLTYLGGLWIVLLAPLMSWLWPALARRQCNPGKVSKCVLGLLLCGLAFLPLVAANRMAGQGPLASVWWLVLAYGVLELGEVCLSPITLAAVSELSLPAVSSLMMGAWLLATSFSEQVAAVLSSLAALEVKPGEQVDRAQAALKYGSLFEQMVWVGVGSAVLALLCAPLLRRWAASEPASGTGVADADGVQG